MSVPLLSGAGLEVKAAVASSPETPRLIQQEEVRGSKSQFESGYIYSRLNVWIEILDWLAVAMVSFIAIALHVRFVTHVGGLWRDEANSVQLATLPHLSELWRCLEFDSFPLVFFGVLRGWTAIFGAHNQAALRVLGLLTGLGILATLWFTARALGAKKPVLSLALIGLNPMLIRYGDSTRAYGLGILLVILTFATFWRLVERPPESARRDPFPSRSKVVAAVLVALLSTQCVYYNSVLLFAIITAAIVVCVRRGLWRTGFIAFGIGLVAAASLLPYLPMMIRTRDWKFLVSYPVDLAWLWRRSCEVFGSPDPLAIWIWVGLFGLTLSSTATILCLALRSRRQAVDRQANSGSALCIPDAVLFAVISLTVAVPAYALFLQALHYFTQPWYYITLAALVACAIDIAFAAWPIVNRFHWSIVLRGLRPVVAIGLLCLVALPDWKNLTTRHTDMDLIAARLTSLTTKGDLVLVTNWETAVALSYHYSGPAEIVTIPYLSDHRFHRYDLVLQQMRSEDPIQRIRPRLEKALESGHSVFVAGTLYFPSPSVRLNQARLSPQELNVAASRNTYGSWQLEVGQFIRDHATGAGDIPIRIPGNDRVQPYENVKLSVVRGWR